MATLGTSWTNIGSQSFSVGGYGHTAYIYAKLNHQSGLTSYIDLELRINYSVWLQSYDTDFYLSGYGWLGYAYREWSAGTYTIMSSSITVGHDSSGNASFAAQGGYEYKGMGVSATTFWSSTYNLPKITVNYTVTYNANGGSGQPGNQTKVHGTNLTLSSTIPSWSGHTFKHWNTAANGSGTSYDPGDTYTANANVTLYAQWDNESYTITYNANGGDGAPDTSTKVYGQVTYLSPITPTRGGYTFFRWNTAANGTGQDYSPAGAFNINANTTLYATWIQNAAPPDMIHDCYINIRDTWIPSFAYINVGGTWYFVKRTGLKVSNAWKDVSNKF